MFGYLPLSKSIMSEQDVLSGLQATFPKSSRNIFEPGRHLVQILSPRTGRVQTLKPRNLTLLIVTLQENLFLAKKKIRNIVKLTNNTKTFFFHTIPLIAWQAATCGLPIVSIYAKLVEFFAHSLRVAFLLRGRGAIWVGVI